MLMRCKNLFRLNVLVFVIQIFLFGGMAIAVDEFRINVEPLSNITISAKSPLDKLPFDGAYPVIIEISNQTDSQKSWLFSATAHGYSQYKSGSVYINPELHFSKYLEVPAGQVETFEINVPLPFSYDSHVPYMNVWLDGSLSGYGVTYGSFSSRSAQSEYGKTPTSPSSLTEYTVFSKALSFNPSLEDILKPASQTLNGTTDYPAELLPRDWRALSGVVQFWITSAEYRTLSTAQQSAMRDWVLQGGSLYLVSPEAGDSLLGDITGDTQSVGDARLGLGEVRVVQAQENKIGTQLINDHVLSLGHSTVEGSLESKLSKSAASWVKLHDFGGVGRASYIIVLLMLVYGALAGPVNLFIFTSLASRARVYITTPLLAIGASILLCVAVLIQDRIGGSGYRSATVYLNPQDKRAVVFQEQISRSGLLLSSGFDSASHELLSPILVNNTTTTQGVQYIDDNSYTQGWFGSRSTQAQFARAIVPTRAHVEVVMNPRPRLLSHINATLKNIIFIDQGGKWWQAREVSPGQSVELSPIQGKMEFTSVETRDSPVREAVVNSFPRRNFFVAQFSGRSEFAIETLDAIAWNDESTMIVGPATISKTLGESEAKL